MVELIIGLHECICMHIRGLMGKFTLVQSTILLLERVLEMLFILALSQLPIFVKF